MSSIFAKKQREAIETLNVRRIKQLMQMRNITQAELAEELGLSGAMVTYFMKGLKVPSLLTLVRIADYFDVTLDELVIRH